MTISFVFTNSFSKIVLTKKNTVGTCAASTGGPEKYLRYS
jgi:hypothetical protein